MKAGIDPWKRSVGREGKLIFAGRVDVFVQHVNGAELIEFEAGQFGDPILAAPRGSGRCLPR